MTSNQPGEIRIGTRGSKLALWQSNWVADQLQNLGYPTRLVVISTTGDVTAGTLSSFGGQGVFTSRIQQALIDNEVDLAVHSLKDLPTVSSDGLTIAAVPERENPSDAIVSNNPEYTGLADLPKGAIVGTGSIRRKAQLLSQRPDLDIQEIRGNVDTRLKKLDDGLFDAIVLATSGLTRLGWQNRIRFELDLNTMLPAVGQGALALEVRVGCPTASAVSLLSHQDSYQCVTAERAMLRRLRAGCHAPVGALTSVSDQQLKLTGAVLSQDGTRKIQAELSDSVQRADELGTALAEQLIEQGASELLTG